MAQISLLTGARWLFEASHSYISRARYSIARLESERSWCLYLCLCSVCDGFTRTDSFAVNKDATHTLVNVEHWGSRERQCGFLYASDTFDSYEQLYEEYHIGRCTDASSDMILFVEP
jgi:hypothetical protein